MAFCRTNVVIASEAKQSRGTSDALRLVDRRVASLLAMTIPTKRRASRGKAIQPAALTAFIRAFFFS
jgi:hypothetical protein